MQDRTSNLINPDIAVIAALPVFTWCTLIPAIWQHPVPARFRYRDGPLNTAAERAFPDAS